LSSIREFDTDLNCCCSFKGIFFLKNGAKDIPSTKEGIRALAISAKVGAKSISNFGHWKITGRDVGNAV
jgi:hypothetical protein